jgi:hypothetical protein
VEGRVMPKQIPMSEKREWLQKSDEGMTTAQIAKEKEKALKVVKRGIEEARAERDGAAARAEIVKDALKDHQHQLMAIVKRLLDAAEPPPPDLELRREKNGSLVPIPIPAGRILYAPEQGLIVELSDENTALWGLLREHFTTRDRIWSAIKNWKGALVNHIQARTGFELGIKMLIEKETCFSVIKERSPNSLENYINPFTIQLFYTVQIRKTLGISDETNPQDRIFAGDDGYVRNGEGGSEMAFCLGKQQECREALIKAFNMIPGLSETKKVIATDLELKNVSNKLKRMLEDIKLMGLIPGRCRICSRISL